LRESEDALKKITRDRGANQLRKANEQAMNEGPRKGNTRHGKRAKQRERRPGHEAAAGKALQQSNLLIVAPKDRIVRRMVRETRVGEKTGALRVRRKVKGAGSAGKGLATI